MNDEENLDLILFSLGIFDSTNKDKKLTEHGIGVALGCLDTAGEYEIDVADGEDKIAIMLLQLKAGVIDVNMSLSDIRAHVESDVAVLKAYAKHRREHAV